MTASDSYFVVSGGPGSGKSTLIQTLAAQGMRHMPEAGRAVIREEMASGGSALPWMDKMAFAERMFAQDIASYDMAQRYDGPVLFDRGLPDTVGYLQLCGLPVPQAMTAAVHGRRYNRRVLLAPPWRAIFAQDAERKQDFGEAEATFAVMQTIYSRLGYETVLLPMVEVAERARFVRDVIEKS